MKDILLYLLLILSPTYSFANSMYPLESPRQEAQFDHLLRDLRCLVCQNQNLIDSNADLANDLRDEVYHLVKENKSDTEITQYLTARYGDFILFNPPVKSVTAFLWFGPTFFLVIGFIIFRRSCSRTKNHA